MGGDDDGLMQAMLFGQLCDLPRLCFYCHAKKIQLRSKLTFHDVQGQGRHGNVFLGCQRTDAVARQRPHHGARAVGDGLAINGDDAAVFVKITVYAYRQHLPFIIGRRKKSLLHCIGCGAKNR